VNPVEKSVLPATSAATVTPRVIHVNLKRYLGRLRYLAPKMKRTIERNAIPEARGFFQLKRLEKKEW